jgi:hypothetical protein
VWLLKSQKKKKKKSWSDMSKISSVFAAANHQGAWAATKPSAGEYKDDALPYFCCGNLQGTILA